MFNESPACANKGDSDEQKSTLQSERETDTAVRDFVLSHFLFCPGSLLQLVKPQTQTNALLFIILASVYPTTVKQMYLLTTVYHSNITLHSQLSIYAIFSWGSHPFTHREQEKTRAAAPSYHSHKEQIRHLNISTKKSTAFLLFLLLHSDKYQFSAAALYK